MDVRPRSDIHQVPPVLLRIRRLRPDGYHLLRALAEPAQAMVATDTSAVMKINELTATRATK